MEEYLSRKHAYTAAVEAYLTSLEEGTVGEQSVASNVAYQANQALRDARVAYQAHKDSGHCASR
jgi:hypothetical protein